MQIREQKACVQRLLDAGVPHNTTAQLSGHKNIASLNRYSIASEDQQRQMSNILTGVQNTFDPRPTTNDDQPRRAAVTDVRPRPQLSTHQSAVNQFPQVPGMFANTQISGGSFNFTFNISGSSSLSQGSPS